MTGVTTRWPAALLFLAAVLPLASAAPHAYPQCRSLARSGKTQEAAACWTRLAGQSNLVDRAEAFWAQGELKQANELFQEADRAEPNSPEIKVEWGKLFLDGMNSNEAANLFKEALGIDENYAAAYLGLARTAARSYDHKAADFAHQALQHDPKLFEAHELLAYLALEDSHEEDAAKEAKEALVIQPAALDGMAVLASIDLLQDHTDSSWLNQLRQTNPHYGEAYATIGHFFVINRRYDEAIGFYRKAIEIKPDLWAAHSELGINLMRTGKTDAAYTELKSAYEAGYRNAETSNSLKVLDSLKTFATVSANGNQLLLSKKEAKLLQPYAAKQLDESIHVYEQKYKMKLNGPVRLEIYPDHDDFIVRTLGLPGQGGLLGVTFGRVVAMDSPSARAPGAFSWAATIHHELSHVFVVTATKDRSPRWFAEGLAVHEEGKLKASWGDRLTPDVITAIREKKLLPVADLERGFIHPTYPAQVLVSYFQAGKMCDYISERWQEATLLEMMHAFAARKSTEETIQQTLAISPQQFDKDFAVWLEGNTKGIAGHLDEWKEHMRRAQSLLKEGKRNEAKAEEMRANELYPDFVQGGNAYKALADISLQAGDTAGAAAQMESYRDRGGRDVALLKQLAELEVKAGQPAKAIDTYNHILDFYLEDEDVHRRLGTLHLESGDKQAAVQEFQAVLATQPADLAQSHYDLARALLATNKKESAREEILASLEAAPGFKPAQKLLLQLSQ